MAVFIFAISMSSNFFDPLYFCRLIQGTSDCDVTMLLKVWCLAEQYNWGNLRETVLQVLDVKLEKVLADDLFLYLGLEEIESILKRPTLCVRSEKVVFDALVDWVLKKVDVDDAECQELALRLFQLLHVDQLNKSIVLRSLAEVGIDKTSVKFRRPDKRTCQNCIFLALHSRLVIQRSASRTYLRAFPDN